MKMNSQAEEERSYTGKGVKTVSGDLNQNCARGFEQQIHAPCRRQGGVTTVAAILDFLSHVQDQSKARNRWRV